MVKTQLEEDLKKVLENLRFKTTDIVLSIPKNPDFGDYTLNIALQLANQKLDNGKHSSIEIAKKIVSHLGDLNYLEKTEVAGAGFINFFIRPQVLLESLHKVCDYSTLVNPDVELEVGEKKKIVKKIVIEHTSPNTNKPLHVGHLRNNILSMSVIKLLETLGNDVQPTEIINDRGIHIAKSMWGYLMKYIDKGETWVEKLDYCFKKPNSWPTPISENKRGDYFNGDCYVYAEQQLSSKPDLSKEHQEILQAWENKNEKVLKLWETMNSWFYESSEITYNKIGSLPSDRWYESQVYEVGKEIVLEGLKKGIFKKGDNGEIYADLSQFNLPDKVLLRGDGTAIYITQDIALTKLRMDKYKADRYMWVVGGDQELHFKQLFAILELLGEKGDKFFHLAYGMIFLPSGQMSSREGNVVLADDLIEEVKNRIKEIMNSNKELSAEEKEQVIESVGMGAIKFSMLKFSPQTDITFDIDKSVALEGDSGPYVQYTYARAKSVLRNAQYDYDVDLPHSDSHPQTVSGDLEKEERLLLQKVEHFETIISEAAENLHPNILASFLLELASLFNLFYQKHPIIKGDKPELRLAITCAVAIILKQGLYLLGIEAPERM